MRIIFSLLLVVTLVGGSIYLFLQKPAPQKYIDLIVEEKDSKKTDPIKLLFVGDIMLDRGIRRTIEQRGFEYILEDIKQIFVDKDLVIGNLEGTVTDNDSISVVNNQILHFTFATSTAEDLKKAGFGGFSMANNHSLDFYQAGFEETKNNLNAAGLFSFGHPLNNQSLSYQAKINNDDICFVGYHSLYNATTTNVTSELRRLRPRCSYVVVFAHWGIEYEDIENEDQRKQARSFIDEGADLVIGAHPHVIEPIEVYKNKAIFYSLGNFIFDQDFSLKTQRGIVIELILDDRNQTFKIIPTKIYKGKLNFSEINEYSESLFLLTKEINEDLRKRILEKKEFSIPR